MYIFNKNAKTTKNVHFKFKMENWIIAAIFIFISN